MLDVLLEDISSRKRFSPAPGSVALCHAPGDGESQDYTSLTSEGQALIPRWGPGLQVIHPLSVVTSFLCEASATESIYVRLPLPRPGLPTKGLATKYYSCSLLFHAFL